MNIPVVTCEDFEEQGLWDTDECCSLCHEADEDDSDHEMRGESWQGKSVYICLPLFEHLFCGAERRIVEEKKVNEFGETSIKWLDEEERVAVETEVPLREAVDRFDAAVKRLVSNARPYEG